MTRLHKIVPTPETTQVKKTEGAPAFIPKSEEHQSQIKVLIAKGKEQGYLTYAEVNDHLPENIVDPEQIEEVVGMINDMGITVYEVLPDADELLLIQNPVTSDEDDATEEAAVALATLDAEFGRTSDPVRMYMREMGFGRFVDPTRRNSNCQAHRARALNRPCWHSVAIRKLSCFC